MTLDYLVQRSRIIAIQINGKLRDVIEVQGSKFKVQSFVDEEARKREKIRRHLEGRHVKKVIYVEGKI